MSEAILLRATLPRPGFTLDVDLQLPARGITAIYGASGSGKTTLLRCMAGLERPQPARIAVGDEPWHDSERGLFVPTHERALGYVFQEPSLFDHLDVRGNLAFARRRARAGGPGDPGR